MSETTLYLIRHAIAEERGDEWPDDDLRPLTKEGMRRFAEAVPGFFKLEQAPQRVVSSPLVRARQTAELLAEGIKPRVTVLLMDELAPGESPGSVLTQVRKLDDYESLALVGHEPDLGHLAAHLLGARQPLPFKKGGMCRIDVTWGRPPRGTLVWFLPPRALRRIGRGPDDE